MSPESIVTKAGPLVSVIVTSYNYGRFLATAIESVLSQTYQNFELIVVDDGSTDNSREVIEFYGDRLIAIFQENAGQIAAVNAGVARSRGEIICLLDSDDCFRKDKLEKVVAGFQDHPDWMQISHLWTSINESDLPIRQMNWVLSQGDVRNLLLRWGKYGWTTTSGLSYRRSVLQQVLPIPEKRNNLGFMCSPDTYLTATVPFYGKVGCIREPLMCYRIHGKNYGFTRDNLLYFIHRRELTAAYINEAATKTGLTDRFELQRDADYHSFKLLHQGGGVWTEGLQTVWLTLQESIALGRDGRDTLTRILHCCIYFLFPKEGREVLRLGLRDYVRCFVVRQERS